MSDNKLHVYLYLPGTVRQAFTLYQQVFGVPLGGQPWGYSGQCTDQFGVAWELSVR